MLIYTFSRFVRMSQVTGLCRVMKALYKYPSNGKPSRKLALTTPFAVASIWGLVRKDRIQVTVTAKEVLLAKADATFEQGEYTKIYDLLNKYRDDKDVEILWRICRALYNMSQTASEVESKRMIYEAYDLICTAIDIDDNHYAVRKWMSVLLHSKSSYEGMKEKIKQLYNIKMHMMKASELNPKDATILYMLGNWCFQISDLTWYQRKIATVAFGEAPSSTFEEALEYFERAEEVDPKFYSQNLLMLGKTYLKLKRKEDALKYLKMVSEFPAKNDDDHKAKQEALKLLNSIK